MQNLSALRHLLVQDVAVIHRNVTGAQECQAWKCHLPPKGSDKYPFGRERNALNKPSQLSCDLLCEHAVLCRLHPRTAPCDVLLSPWSHFTDEETGATEGRALARAGRSLHPGRAGDECVLAAAAPPALSWKPHQRAPRGALPLPGQALARTDCWLDQQPLRRCPRVSAFWPRFGARKR